MLELRRCLKDKAGNTASKLLHLILKSKILGIIRDAEKLPTPTKANIERVNTMVFIRIRDNILAGLKKGSERNYRNIKALFNFVIAMADSDEYYAQIIYEVTDQLRAAEDWETVMKECERWTGAPK